MGTKDVVCNEISHVLVVCCVNLFTQRLPFLWSHTERRNLVSSIRLVLVSVIL